MKILLIGKTGQLGSQLLQDIPKFGHTIVAPNKQELNILGEEDSFRKILVTHKPSIVINTAAFNNLTQSEIAPQKAFQLNSIAVTRMAKILSEFKIWFVTFSTNYVFDGTKKSLYTEYDMPQPLQFYGLSKLAGEYGVLPYKNSIIIRTSTLYGSNYSNSESSKYSNFVDIRIDESKNVKSIMMSCEQTVSSTYIPDLSKAVIQLISHPQTESGIYHLVNEGYHTWYEFTKEIYSILNINTEVIPVDRKGIYGMMRRPLFSALENTKAKRLGIELPYWKDSLRKYLEEKYGSRN